MLTQLPHAIGRRVTVRDAPLGQLPERIGRQRCWRVARPVHHHGGVRQQEWKDQCVEVFGQFRAVLQNNDFAGPGIVAQPQLPVQLSLDVIVLYEGDDAAGMLATRSVSGLNRGLNIGMACINHQGEDAGQRHCPTLFTFVDEPPVDVSNGCVVHVDNHGRLQLCPSRRTISSAESGPQVPARYGSGFPLLAQYSMTGSRISHDNSTSR